MITLITGTPGSGKTLRAVFEAAREVKAGRHLKVDGIKGLALDHDLVDETWVRKWFDHVQPQDLIIIDEVQRLWPPRSVSTKAGEDIEKLHVHRHRGVDFVLITQHPQRLDKAVRDLVGRHVHVRRLFGMKQAMLYEWDHCHNIGNLKDAVKKRWSYPRDVFKMYVSAEVHTKQTAVVPKALFVIPVALIVAAVAAWKAAAMVHGGMGKSNVKTPDKESAAGAVSSSASGEGEAAGENVKNPSAVWRVAGRYANLGSAYVVLANGAGELRVVKASGFTGSGARTAGQVDGSSVADWTGVASGTGAGSK
ncbi:zona occludens toxin [Robbsia andropogonis]|uniref:zonular occludens toxin domain-containing protein n=1 Tax=Robbsia andropogonis TaxID=28092 RepID=UPI003D1DE2A8